MAPWKRTYWVVFASNLVTSVGMMSFLPFFPALLEDLGVTDPGERMVWSGVLTGAAPLAAAAMGPLWGSLGDRIGRKGMLLRALVAIALFVGLMGVARSPWELLLMRMGQGLFSGFVPPSVALVSVHAPPELQGRVTSTVQAAMPVGSILGPYVGAAIQTSYGFDQLFLFVACAAITSAVLVLTCAHEDPSLRLSLERFSPSSVLAHALGDLQELVAKPRIRRGLIILAAAHFGVGATTPQLLLYVEELLGVGGELATTRTAWLFTAMAAAGVVSTPLWGRIGDRSGHARVCVLAGAGTTLVLGGCSLVPSFAALLAARIALGLSNPGISVGAAGLAATETRAEKRGGAFGATFSARAFALSIGSISGGWIAGALGIRGLFAVCAAVILVVLLAGASARRNA